jgi:hypothetical protein
VPPSYDAIRKRQGFAVCLDRFLTISGPSGFSVEMNTYPHFGQRCRRLTSNPYGFVSSTEVLAEHLGQINAARLAA